MNRKSNNYTKIKAWDKNDFEMSNSQIKVRFIRFIEEVHKKDKVEIKESWIITTDKFTSVETLWKINIIEDLRDEMLLVQNWINPIFDNT